MLKRIIICLSLVVCMSPATWAADQSVLTCVDDLVYGVIRLDTKAADFSKSLDALLNLASQTLKPHEAVHLRNAVSRSRNIMETDLGTFQQAGGREIYAVFNLRDLPLFFLAFPVDTGVNPEQVQKAIGAVVEHSFNIDDLSIEPHGSLILVGKTPILKAAKAATGPINPLWETLLDKKPVRPLRIVVVPNEMQLRVLKEMWPAMPGVPGLDQLKIMIQQCKWLTLSAQVVPSMAFEISLEVQTKDMADQVAAFWKVMAPFIAEPLHMDKDVLNQIQVNAQGQQVTWSLDHAQSQKVLGYLFLEPVHRLTCFAQQMACGTNVSDMGKAILLYANDHNDQMPPSLDILKNQDLMPKNCAMPEKGLICPGVGTTDSYGYCGDGLDCSCEPTVILVYDKKGNHAESFRNVLFLDSHVEWVSEERFQELAAKVNQVRKERGLPEHVFE